MMAELCLNCWNKMNNRNDPPSKYIISKDLQLCEGCGRITNVIIVERKYYYMHILKLIIYPFKILFSILCMTIIIPLLPIKFIIKAYNTKGRYKK